MNDAYTVLGICANKKGTYMNSIPPSSCPHLMINSFFFLSIDKDLLRFEYNVLSMSCIPKQ